MRVVDFYRCYENNIEEFQKEYEKLGQPEEFEELVFVGKHKVYHLETDALTHSCVVWTIAKQVFTAPEEQFMHRIAMLHDIGKIYTSIRHSDGYWEYPDHSTCGSFKGILAKFIPLDDPEFRTTQWYIANHIKPLFWKWDPNFNSYFVDTTDAITTKCSPKLLARLAYCDIVGSIPVPEKYEEQEELAQRLLDFSKK